MVTAADAGMSSNVHWQALLHTVHHSWSVVPHPGSSVPSCESTGMEDVDNLNTFTVIIAIITNKFEITYML